jgi:hypothetical protein
MHSNRHAMPGVCSHEFAMPGKGAMTRTVTRFAVPAIVAFAIVATGATAFGSPPYKPSAAQKQAEYACVAQDVKPGSPVWEPCLSHVTRAYDWDEPALALQLAHAAGKAQASCREDGLLPTSTDYRACVDHELQAQSQLMVLGDDGASATNVAEVH